MTLCLAAAAAAAAPVAPLATEGAGPAEAVLPAGAAMGLGSHGECTVGVSPLPPLPFFVVVLGLEILCVRGLGCSAAPDVGAHGECINFEPIVALKRGSIKVHNDYVTREDQ